MNLDERRNLPKITYPYMQPTDLFHIRAVVDYCEYRERQIVEHIHSIPHREMLSLDRETLFTQLIDSYLSDEITDYPVLNIDKAELLSNSDQTTISVLYTIPLTGAPRFFVYRPEGEYSHPSEEVTIHLDESNREITLYYKLPRNDSEGDFQEHFQTLLANDISWIVDSLDDVIRHFREHEERLKGIMGKALAQRTEAVFEIEGIMESIEMPEDMFNLDRLSVSNVPMTSHERNPRYDVFKPLLFGQQEGKCKGTNFEIFYSEATVDHILPKALGGKDELINLQALCEPCNGLKDDGPLEDYLQQIEKDPSICTGYGHQE